jgi:uncharacterized membrane protein YqjE
MGLINSIKTLTDTLLDLAQTRLELLAVDLEEDRLRVMRLAFVSFLMLFFFFLGVVLITLLIIIAFWDQYQLLTIGLIAILYFILAGALAIYLMRQLKGKSRPKLFSASLAEIMKDRIALGVRE